MKAYDRGSSLFWLLLSLYVAIASFRMESEHRGVLVWAL